MALIAPLSKQDMHTDLSCGKWTALPAAWLRAAGSRLLQDESGQSIMIVIFLFSILLLGFVAIGVDVGYLFHQERMAQAAADAAAVAAAEEMSVSNSSTAQQTAANAMAKLNGFDPADSVLPATVTLSTPSSGNYISSSYVQAVVSRQIPTFFLGFLNPSATKITVAARAVAGGGTTVPTCICLEAASGNGLGMSNNAQLSAPTCGVTVDSSSSNAVSIVGSSTLSALSLGTISSTWNNSSNINNNGSISSTTKVVQGIKNACSLSLTAPTAPSVCNSNPIQGWTAANNYTGKYTLPASGDTVSGTTVCYNSLDTSQSSSVTFTSGYTYYIKGDFTTGGGSPLTGSGVSFYVGGNVNIANGVTVNLTAPYESDGTTLGTLFDVNGTSVTIQGGSTSTLSGLLYAPNAAVTLNNGTGTTLNMDVYAQSLNMSGGATLSSYADKNLSSLTTGGSSLVE